MSTKKSDSAKVAQYIDSAEEAARAASYYASAARMIAEGNELNGDAIAGEADAIIAGLTSAEGFAAELPGRAK